MVLICQSGARARKARQVLVAAGAQQVIVLDGGMAEWQGAGGATETGRATWVMERQVRLVAGSLVTAGVLASTRWRPTAALSGAVGAGLVFAAVSNTCAMGELLARLPYNRGPRSDVRPQCDTSPTTERSPPQGVK